MKRRSFLLATPALILPRRLRGQALPWPGPTTVVPSSGVYVGPGDVVSGAVAWWGLRAYTNASIGSNCVKLRRDSDNATQTFATIAGGGLDSSAIATFRDAVGAASLFIDTFYDQSGNSRDLTQSALGRQPKFTLSGLGSLPVVTLDAAYDMNNTSFVTSSVPFTFSHVTKNTNSASQTVLVTDGANNANGYRFSAANKSYLFNGSFIPEVTTSDNNYHAIQWVINIGASDINVDGSVNTVDVGTSNAWGGTITVFAYTLAALPSVGTNTEVGMWASAFSSTQSSNMSSNQHSYWGF